MLKRPVHKNREGFSTLEILLAFFVLSFSIVAIISMVYGGQSLTIDSQTYNEAAHKAQAMLEAARASSTQDFYSVAPIATTTDAADPMFVKSLDIQPVDLWTEKVTSTVSWNAGGARNPSVQLATLLTNPDGFSNGGSTCNTVLSGDWTNPQLLGRVDVGQNNGGTDVDVFNRMAYVTTDASAVNKPDFYIVDVSNPNINDLPVINSLNTGPGLKALHVAGRYAYVANESINGQLQIIDVQVSPPQIVSTYKITVVTGNGAQALGDSIFYKDGYVYLGLTTTASGPEFNIIDVRNPAVPVWIGGYAIGHDVNAIFVRGIYAYVASPDNAELKIFDISNPSSPSLVGQVDLPDNSANGKSIAIVGNMLYLGRTQGASPSTNELQLMNITNPMLPVLGASADIDSTINAISIRDNLAFMVTSDTNLGFQIWDLNTMTLFGSKNVQQTSTGGMDCEGNYIYIAQRSNKALQIIGPGP